MGSSGFLQAVAIGVALFILPSGALAQATDDGSRAAARDLGTSGVEAFQKGDFNTASEKLEKAFQVLRVPSIGLWSARALEKTGKLVKASERYRAVGLLEISAGQATIQRQAQTDAATELAALTPRLAAITVQIEGGEQGDLKVSVDGLGMAKELIGERRPADPGKHVVEAWQGAKRASAEVQLTEGEATTVVLRFDAASAPVAPSNTPAPAESPVKDHQAGGSGLTPQRKAALAVGGLGVVGVAVGAIFGFKAKSKLHDSDRYCTGDACTDQRGVDLNNEAKQAGTISTIGFIIGGVGLAGGTALWLTAPHETGVTQVGLGYGSLLVRGNW